MRCGWALRERSCARRERGGRLGFRAFARGGSGCGRSNARSGPVPLLLGGSTVGLALGVSLGGAPRDRPYARREAQGKMEISRCARGESLFASYARSGPVPLPPGCIVGGMEGGMEGGMGGGRLRGFRGLREELLAGRLGLAGGLPSLPPGYDHLRRCFGAGFEAFGACSSGFYVVNGSVGVLFGGRGCGSGRSARL